jgi:hypothetical protein
MAENMVLLETIELTQSAASVTFDNIPQTGYTDLKIVASTRLSSSATDDVIGININGTGRGTNFSTRVLQGSGSSATSGTSTNWLIGGTNANNSTANTYTNWELYIPNYLSSNAKSMSVDSVMENNATTAYAELTAVLYNSTAAISSLAFLSSTASFMQYSTFSLYGLAAVGTTPAVAPKATGGNIVANDGTYWYHAFLTSGTFTPQTALTCDYLVVAGGGGGGGTKGANVGYGGGGGAGGYRSATSQSLTAQTYTIIIGAGGAGTSAPTNGGDSAISGSGFTTFTSTGGGFGGNITYAGRSVINDGANGGSGGGAGNEIKLGGLGNTPSTSPSQGNNGGAGYVGGGNAAGSGGGGASAAGSAGTNNSAGGAGGSGSNAHSSWATVTSTGASGYYAGGGGGGVENAT